MKKLWIVLVAIFICFSVSNVIKSNQRINGTYNYEYDSDLKFVIDGNSYHFEGDENKYQEIVNTFGKEGKIIYEKHDYNKVYYFVTDDDCGPYFEFVDSNTIHLLRGVNYSAFYEFAKEQGN